MLYMKTTKITWVPERNFTILILPSTIPNPETLWDFYVCLWGFFFTFWVFWYLKSDVLNLVTVMLGQVFLSIANTFPLNYV